MKLKKIKVWISHCVIGRFIYRKVRRYQIHKELIELIDRKNYLTAYNFPFTEKVDAMIHKLELERNAT